MKLLYNACAVLLPPLPALFEKSVTSQICLVNPLLLQFVNDLNLRGDRRMVRSRLPERFISLHPLIADQNVLHGIVQSMSHVQLACDIGRGHHDGKGLFILVYLCVKILSL